MYAWYDREIQIDVVCESILGITVRQYRNMAKEDKQIIIWVTSGIIIIFSACVLVSQVRN